MNRKTAFIMSLVFLNLLSSCSDNLEQKDIEVTKNEEINYSAVSEIQSTQSKQISENTSKLKDEAIKELVIDERCIGCGKCAMIAPNNFSMDFKTLKAVVTSQKDMFSREVNHSIQACPVDSIHIG